LWQRFLLASSLVVGVFVGVAATVFGYSNLARVDIHWSIFHVNGIPLWTVALVPLALFLLAGTLYHWADGLHHFTEHMRHRRRVHELETEVASLRAHLDQILEMPDHSTSRLPAMKASIASLPAADEGISEVDTAAPEPLPLEAKKVRSVQRRRVTLDVAGDPSSRDRSGSHVEGMIGDGKAAEPQDSLEQEA
jgi:hypothetical protein